MTLAESWRSGDVWVTLDRVAGRVIAGASGAVKLLHHPKREVNIHRRRLTHALLACVLIATPAFANVEASTRTSSDAGPAVVGTVEPLALLPALDEAGRAGAIRIWRHGLNRPGASFLRAHLADLNLHPGDVLLVRAGSGREIERLTRRGPKDRGSFWTLAVFEESLNLELRFHAPYDHEPPFRVDQLLVGDAGLFAPALDAPDAPESVCAPEDFDDVFCFQSDAGKWANVLASVGVMTVDGNPSTGLWCSGANVSRANYILTNDHCIGDQGGCDNAEFVFKFYRQGCNNGAPTTPDYQSFRCDEVVANSPYLGSCEAGINDLDFTLASVIGDPAATFGHVEPDPTPLTSGEAIYIVQHPAGRPHEIAHGGGANVVVDTAGNLRTIRYYDTLDTEGGSSGSPIFRESDDRLVGLHHCGGCGSPGVGNRGMLMSAIYPLISSFLCSTALDLGEGGYDGLAELAGNGDAAIDPGETWKFTPKVRNNSCAAPASGVVADFAVGASSAVGVALLDDTASFGDIPAGGVAGASPPIRVVLAESIPCGGTVAIEVANILADEGGPFGPFLALATSVDAICHPWNSDQVFVDDFEIGSAARWDLVMP